MEASILIVSKNRKQALEKTLLLLKPMLDFSKHEVLVFLDGCTDNSADLKKAINWVSWCFVEKSVGASPARQQLYKKATGTYFIGFDDDAHPLYSDFITRTITIFNNHENVGIIAFEEIKGLFKSDEAALKSGCSQPEEYLTNEFIGCGFAIRKKVYEATHGFPIWMEIYGEETCLSIEVLSKGYDILFTNTIKINHRVDKEARKQSGKNYFRFEQQLKNTTGYYLIYYKRPLFKILKLYKHNFKKYALTDFTCFKLFFKVGFGLIYNIPKMLKYRQPVDGKVIKKRNNLRPLNY
jgi:GT2 family glycosyltransferase